MNSRAGIRLVEGRLEEPDARRYADFESSFFYPLGPGADFRISHGEDPLRYFRSLGPAAMALVESENSILGTISAAVVSLTTPDGARVPAAYFGNLKVRRDARGRFVLARLLRAIWRWSSPRTDAAFAVVMNGSAVTPEAYTGRGGILPPFRPAAHCGYLRLLTASARESESCEVDDERGARLFERLARPAFRMEPKDPAARSSIEPFWLALPDGSACARVEDTRAAKKLFRENGGEIVSAHVSRLAYASPGSARRIVEAARATARRRGYEGIFSYWPDEFPWTGDPACVESTPGLSVWTHGLPNGPWRLWSSEL